VPFHTDYSKRTMQVPLNDPHEYDGGSLVWAVDGALETPPRPAGSATIHTEDVVHAVTRMSHGTRYSLFLCELPEKNEVDLLHLIDPAVEQLGFFRRAVAFLDDATDVELRACTIEYHQHLVDSIQAEGAEDSDINIEMALPSFEVELIWRAHLLSPVAYARDCAELRGGGESTRLIDHAPLPVESYASRDATMAINAAVAPTSMPQAWHADLMAAVRRQVGFMRQMLKLQQSTGGSGPPLSTDALTAELKSYKNYLVEAAGVENELAVPSLTLDLLWHSHMLFPREYVSECVQIAGVLINHDDS
jgi:hypothetical protein